MLAFLLATVIAFPRPGTQLPPVERCYMIGFVSGGETNVIVQGRNVAVHPMGGWVTMVDCHAGLNTVVAGETNVTFRVAAKPKATATPTPPKVYTKLAYAADTPREHPSGKKPAETTIVVDAGHGGSDTGALSPHGLCEKDINLRVAKALRDELVRRGYRVVMTREDDSFPALYDRPKVAHANKADAFISIHHNAPPYDRDPRAMRYSATYAWNPLGKRLAKHLNDSLAAALGGAIHDNGVMHANFAVTRNPEIPSCLLELDFLTTPEGELDCWNRARQRRLACALADGVVAWQAANQ